MGDSDVDLQKIMAVPGLFTNVALPALGILVRGEPMKEISPVLLKKFRLLPAVAPFRNVKLPLKVCTIPELFVTPPWVSKLMVPLIVNWLAPALNVMS